MSFDPVTAERIRLAIAFTTDIRERYRKLQDEHQAACEAARTASDMSWGGGWDDTPKQPSPREKAWATVGFIENHKADVETEWKLVKRIFGEDTIHLALTELDRKIGDLPFVD